MSGGDVRDPGQDSLTRIIEFAAAHPSKIEQGMRLVDHANAQLNEVRLLQHQAEIEQGRSQHEARVLELRLDHARYLTSLGASFFLGALVFILVFTTTNDDTRQKAAMVAIGAVTGGGGGFFAGKAARKSKKGGTKE